jgi:demethylmenaquinone methyltransferase/2-methoxy-6-polyprenyl-1,4-benzoquinol methylase
MFSFIYMKILESQPQRYDRGISWLSFGIADASRQEIAERIAKVDVRILDLGTGTGTLALAEAARGAQVVGVDPSSAMLEVAEKKRANHPQGANVKFLNIGVAQVDSAVGGGAFDAVSASLILSELSEDEQEYTLLKVFELLKPGGVLAVADETRPAGPWKRLLYELVRLPLALLTFIFTQTSTYPVVGLEERVQKAGFRIDQVAKKNLDSFVLLYAVKPRE